MKVNLSSYFHGVLIGIVILSGVLLSHLPSPTVQAGDSQHNPVKICHATGSSSNPFVQLTVDDDAVDGENPGNSNADHNSDSHQNGEDIIPPGIWAPVGRNWDQTGRNIYNNNCYIPGSTPTPTPTPTPSGCGCSSPSPSPSMSASPSAEPSEEPSPSPSPSPSPEPSEEPEVSPSPSPSPSDSATPAPSDNNSDNNDPGDSGSSDNSSGDVGGISVSAEPEGQVLGAMAATGTAYPLWLSTFTPQVTHQSSPAPVPTHIYIPWNTDIEIDPATYQDGQWTISNTHASYLVSSGLPGQAGNIVIYGHNTRAILGNIRALKGGETITLTLSDRSQRHYQVSSVKVVDPRETQLLSTTPVETLTLYTCTGERDSQRFVVTATPQDQVVSP